MLGGNESETNVINGNPMDVDDENDTNLEVNANLTYDSVIDTESSVSNEDEVDVSDGSELNSSLK